MAGYQWDPAKSERGDDAPLKYADHGCDALRYFAHSTGKLYRMTKPTTVAELGI